MTPAYGVVIPAHDAEATLGEAIRSLLAQTLPPASIVLVDDGSRDGTVAVARSFGTGLEVIRQPHQGVAAATNRGFAQIDCPLIAGLDADDVWLPEKAERQIAELLDDDTLDGVFCQATAFAHGSAPARGAAAHALWGRSAMMLRRRAVMRIGPVDGDRSTHGEMIDWFARGRELGMRFHVVPEVLVGRRRIAGSLMDGGDAAALLPVVRSALRRRRSAVRGLPDASAP